MYQSHVNWVQALSDSGLVTVEGAGENIDLHEIMTDVEWLTNEKMWALTQAN